MKRGTRGKRIAAIGAAGLLSGALVAGCGGSGDGDGDGGGKSAGDGGKRDSGTSAGDSPAQVVRAANKRTTGKETARITMRATATQGGKTEKVDGDGVIDLRDGTSRMDIGQGQQRIEQRVVGKTLYQKPPKEAASQLPGGKSWMKIDLGELEKSGGGSGQFSDPADSLAYTKALSEKDVKKVGSENVRGTKTTHYRVSLDLAKLSKGDAQQEKQLRRQLGDTVPVDMWTDKDGVLRRVQTELKFTAPEGSGSGSGGGKSAQGKVKSVMELSDFGTEVKVKAPAAGQTADVTKQVAKGGGEQT